MKIITAEIAYRIRFEHGCKLSISGKYEYPRLQQIASLQNRHFTAIEQLDEELKELAENAGDYSI